MRGFIAADKRRLTPFRAADAELLRSVVVRRRPRVRLENELLVLSTMKNSPRRRSDQGTRGELEGSGRDIMKASSMLEFCIIRLGILTYHDESALGVNSER